MGATNHTTNYELSQFIGTDKPSWLNDYNNDMLKIDTAVKANATAASGAQSTANTADGKADANALAIQTLNTQINTPSTGLAATVASHTTDITGINTAIGNTPLTTVAQTLTGAIEEVKGSIPSLSNVLSFNGVKTLVATATGSETYSEMIDDVFSQFTTYITSKTASYRFQFDRFAISSEVTAPITNSSITNNTYSVPIIASLAVCDGTDLFDFYIICRASNSRYAKATNGTSADLSSTLAPNGTTFTIYFNEFTLN